MENMGVGEVSKLEERPLSDSDGINGLGIRADYDDHLSESEESKNSYLSKAFLAVVRK
jgi:hypothetical protein